MYLLHAIFGVFRRIIHVDRHGSTDWYSLYGLTFTLGVCVPRFASHKAKYLEMKEIVSAEFTLSGEDPACLCI